MQASSKIVGNAHKRLANLVIIIEMLRYKRLIKLWITQSIIIIILTVWISRDQVELARCLLHQRLLIIKTIKKLQRSKMVIRHLMMALQLWAQIYTTLWQLINNHHSQSHTNRLVFIMTAAQPLLLNQITK